MVFYFVLVIIKTKRQRQSALPLVCRKTYIFLKMGFGGVAPSGVRAAAPHSAPSRGEGVFGKYAEIRTHQALHEAKLSECPKGDRDREFTACFIKTDFFHKLKTAPSGTAFNVYEIIAITPVRWGQSLFFSEPLKLRERQSMRELRLLYPL